MTEAYPRPAVTAVLSVADMRRSDAYTIEHFTDSKTLMARAGQGLFEACKWHGRVAVVCGSGNNAGDGYVLAALLAEAGIDVHIILFGRKVLARRRVLLCARPRVRHSGFALGSGYRPSRV